jgi:hypothetical protein
LTYGKTAPFDGVTSHSISIELLRNVREQSQKACSLALKPREMSSMGTPGTTGSEWEFQRKVRGTKAEELIHWRKSQEILMNLRRNVRGKKVRIGSK